MYEQHHVPALGMHMRLYNKSPVVMYARGDQSLCVSTADRDERWWWFRESCGHWPLRKQQKKKKCGVRAICPDNVHNKIGNMKIKHELHWQRAHTHTPPPPPQNDEHTTKELEIEREFGSSRRKRKENASTCDNFKFVSCLACVSRVRHSKRLLQLGFVVNSLSADRLTRYKVVEIRLSSKIIESCVKLESDALRSNRSSNDNLP